MFSTGTNRIVTIACKEFLEMRRDGRLWIAAFMASLLFLISGVVGIRYSMDRGHVQTTVQNMERQRWLNKGAMHPHEAAHYGFYVVKPMLGLAAADWGIDPYAGIANHLEAHQQKLFEARTAQDGRPVPRAREVSAAALLQIVAPLFIIVLLFPLFATEREQGTLRYVLGSGISKRQLILGKVIGVLTPLLAILFVSGAIGLTWLFVSSVVGEPAVWLPRLTAMIAAYGLYLFIHSGMTIAVSALASSTRQALLILLASWAANCIIAGPALMDATNYIAPSPNGFQFVAEIQADSNRGSDLDTMKMEARRRLAAIHGENYPFSEDGIGLFAEEERDTALYRRHVSRLYDSYEAQERIYTAVGFVFPAIAIQSFSMGMAGTDFAHHRDFAEAAEDYRYKMIQTLNEDMALHDLPENRKASRWLAGSADEYIPGQELWQQIPVFEYRFPTLEWAIERHLMDAFVLLAWAVAISAFMAFAFGRLRAD
jgi:ABC-2 type transport system permease protein